MPACGPAYVFFFNIYLFSFKSIHPVSIKGSTIWDDLLNNVYLICEEILSMFYFSLPYIYIHL